jgi:hypothetical protein
LAGLHTGPRTDPHRDVGTFGEVLVQSEEEGDADLLVVFVHLDVMKAIDDPVDEFDPQRLIVGGNVDPLPPFEARIESGRVRACGLAGERPARPAALE